MSPSGSSSTFDVGTKPATLPEKPTASGEGRSGTGSQTSSPWGGDSSNWETRNELKAVSQWYRSLPSSKRDAIRKLHELRPTYNATALLFVVLWGLEAYLMHRFPYVPVRLAGYVLIGFHIHGLANLMHEAVHGNFFRNRSIDRWCGFVLGAPALVSGTAFRVVHPQHHQYNRSEGDPDEISSAVPNVWLRQVAFYAWLLVGMFYYVLVRLPIQAWRLGSRQERRQMIIEYGLLVAIYGAVFAAAASQGAVWSVLHAWIFPAVFTGLFANVRGAAEHMLTEPGHPLTQSRTVRSTRLLSFLNVNLNYHLEHHLFPGMPWYNLPRLHELLQGEYEKAGAFVHGSYLRFIVDALRTGVHGVAQDAR